MRPKAKTEGLLVEELGGEALVYDLDSRMVHRLDHRAFQVWRSCDGHHTIEMITTTMKEEQQGEHLAVDHLAVVEAAVHQLQEAGLLLSGEKEEKAGAKRRPTRRDLLARAAGTAGAAVGGLILVHSIAAPTPAMAASPTPTPTPRPSPTRTRIPPGTSDCPCTWTFIPNLNAPGGQWQCGGPIAPPAGKCHGVPNDNGTITCTSYESPAPTSSESPAPTSSP
jgi:hypothetical protein